MAPLASVAFTAHPLLQRIADGGAERISTAQNSTHAAVKVIQDALLAWRPGVIPAGATGTFGAQTAAAVVTFKQDENLVAPGESVIGDVGPKTVARLDEIQRAAELEGWLDAGLGGLSSGVGSGSVVPRDAVSAFAAFKTAIERCSGASAWWRSAAGTSTPRPTSPPTPTRRSRTGPSGRCSRRPPPGA